MFFGSASYVRVALAFVLSGFCARGETSSIYRRTIKKDRCLLQRDARIKRGRYDKTIPAHWFDGYSKEESTFNPDLVGDVLSGAHAVPSELVREGPAILKDAREPFNDMERDGIRAEWFEESASGGPHEAWRTRFPTLEAFHHEALDRIPFLPDHASRKLQEYLPYAGTSVARVYTARNSKVAPWFEASVADYDEFGRNLPPTKSSDRWYQGWDQKSWSLLIGCEKSGCMANATLTTFDPKEFQHAKCTLSFRVHATDFDDEYSREYVEWLLVNDVRVMTFCDPMARGCGQDPNITKRGMHACVTDYPVDDLLAKGTTLNFASKISEMVDECPVDNKLLNGDVNVTCFLKPWPTPLEKPKPMFASKIQCASETVKLRCHDYGCNASGLATPCTPAKQGQKCLLNMKIWQTDFDQDHGSVEVVEWVKLNGKEVAKDLKPGRNPCKEALDRKIASLIQNKYSGNSQRALAETTDDSIAFQPGSPFKKYMHRRGEDDVMKHIITDLDVTTEVLAEGAVFVEAKISKMVDECGKDGYLLNALATLRCT